MSSLRLALKQSLQEAGPLKPSKSSRKQRDEDGNVKRKKHKSGDHQHKRGRPTNGSHDSDEDGEHHEHHHHGGDSSDDEENEFSAGEEESEEEEGDESDGHSQYNGPRGERFHGNQRCSRHHDDDDDDEHEEGEVVSPPTKAVAHSYRDETRGGSSDEEPRRHHNKQLQKKLKHSAANKIQSQWKKKQMKEGHGEDQGDRSSPYSTARAPEAAEDASESHHDQGGDEEHEQEEGEEQLIKKREKAKQKEGKAKAKTVPPPSHEVLEWNRCLPIKRARKNVAQGLRVKVRFATKVKREGKIVRKKKWFGGRVSAVSKEGSKIRIKYDDGTAEISKFPDKDVVVDDTDNGEHQANASKFLPRPKEESPSPGDPPVLTQQPPSHGPDDHKPSLANVAMGSQAQAWNEEPARPTSPLLEPKELIAKEVVVTTADEVANAAVAETAHPQQTVLVADDVRREQGEAFGLEVFAKALVAAAAMEPAAVRSDGARAPEELSHNSEDPTTSTNTILTASAENIVESSNDKEPVVTSECTVKKPQSEPKLESPKRPSKPTLTIRIPNLKKELHEAKVSPPVNLPAEEESSDDDDDDESSQNPPSNDPAILSLIQRASKKRPAEDSESGSSEEQKRPSKRIYIQTSSFDLGDGNPKAKTSPPASPPGRTEASMPNGPAALAEPSTPDEGPVKLIGRVSAKRVPLFSDEEEEEAALAASKAVAASQKEPKLKRRTSASSQEIAIQEPQSVPEPTEVVQTKRPLAAKKATGESTAFASAEGNALLVSSRNSAFEPKESILAAGKTEEELLAAAVLTGVAAVVSSEAARPSTPTVEKSSFVPVSASSPLIARSGRKAAVEATERIVSTKQEKDGDKDKSKEPPTGKKRRRRDKDGTGKSDEESQSSAEDHNNWIQCDRCAKWRIIPNHVKVSSLPKHWYCENNIYDAKRSSCDAPEQTSQTPVVKKKKRGKKQKVRQPAESAEPQPASEEQGTTVAKKDQTDAGASSKEKTAARALSPAPQPADDTATSNEFKHPSVEAVLKTKQRASPNVVASVEKAPPAVRSEPATIKKKPSKDKKGATGAPSRKRLPDAPLEEIPEQLPPPKVAVKKRGRKARKEFKEKEIKEKVKEKEVVEPLITTASIASTSSSLPQKEKEAEDPDNVEWVQCERCDKWRKLPEHISSDELPDVWYCSMNTWNPKSASCDAPEDKADGQHDVGVFGASSNSGKLSYRNLIFGPGSGRKGNRAISERTRASESIFGQPSEDAECGYPTVMYANSSAFAPRGSRHIIEEEESGLPSVLELMNHSNLWAELRGAALTGFSRPNCQLKTFQSMPRKIKSSMKDMVCRILETKTSLTGDEVVAEMEHRNWENCPPSWAATRPYCTKDIVISLLCELVKEETLGMVKNLESEWDPRYILAYIPSHEKVAPLRASRCMKIAKPWKRTSAPLSSI